MCIYASNSLLCVESVFFVSPITCLFASGCLLYTPDPLTGCFLCCVLERGKIFVRYFPNTHCVTMKFGFVSVNMRTLGITIFFVDSWSFITWYDWCMVWCAVSATRIIGSSYMRASIRNDMPRSLNTCSIMSEPAFFQQECNSSHHR